MLVNVLDPKIRNIYFNVLYDKVNELNPGLRLNSDEYDMWFKTTFEELTGHKLVFKQDFTDFKKEDLSIEFGSELELTMFILRWS